MFVVLGTLTFLGVFPPASAQTQTIPPRVSASPLGGASGPFLQRAARQPVRWRTWGPETFLEASRTHKLIFLYIGASWCHWCQQMGRDCFQSREVYDLLNRDFIPVVVDRDLQPDIDRRYQRVVLTLAGRGGWPLTAILTPEGDVIYGGGYFAPDDRDGYPGLASVLKGVLARYRQNPAAVRSESLKIRTQALSYERVLSNDPLVPGSSRPRPLPNAPSWPSPLDLDTLAGAVLETYDPLYGGFGATPRFTQAPAMELLLAYGDLTGLGEPAERVARSLDAMAQGAIRDPLSGLFFRYSVDDTWHYPGFEVLLTTNAQMLRLYLHAYQVTGNLRFRRVAERIVDGVLAYMTLPEGGFIASLGGEGVDGSEGGYYVWTPDELQAILGQDAVLIQKRMGMEGVSSMPGRPDAYVPLIARTIPEVSRAMGMRPAVVQERLRLATEKLKKARSQRFPQLKDPTLVVSWNALMISSLLEASRVLGHEPARVEALKALSRILAELNPEDGDIPEVLPRSTLASTPQAATWILLSASLIDAFEVEGNLLYLTQARSTLEQAVRLFWDTRAGGFYDIPLTRSQQGMLEFRWKDVIDGVLPATNAVALQVFIRLSGWTGDPRYRELTADILPIFQEATERVGLLGGSLGQALLQQLYRAPRVVVVKGDEGKAKNLAQAAIKTYRPGKGLLISPEETLRSLGLSGLIMPKGDNLGGAYLCGADGCSTPYEGETALIRAIRELGRPQPLRGDYE